MSLNQKNILPNSFVYIFMISLIYGIIAGEGFYGYSNDYYEEYFKSNLIYPSIREKLGSILSTLTIYNIHIGVHLTSFFLSFTTGVILKSIFTVKNLNSLMFFIFILVLILHTHPIIMSTSGAMRQGWTMCFVFLSFAMIVNKKNLLSFFFITIGVFLHKSGLFFLIIYLINLVIFRILKNTKHKKSFVFISGFVIFILSSVGLYFTGLSSLSHRIVHGDFRSLWLLVKISFIFFYFFTFKINVADGIKELNMYLFFFCCSVPAFFFMGLNWQYERINMIIAIPLILLVGCKFTKNSSYLYLPLVFGVYLFLTIFQGMYTIGLT